MQTPLTFDRKTVQTMLEESVIGIAGKRTAIGDAIGLAVKRLRQHPKESRVLILMTDGANTAGEVTPLQAAELATQSNIRIYTIGIGATQMEVQSLFGRRVVNPSQDLDEDTLRAIAEQTNGRYFRATSTEELAAIYELLNDLEPTQADSATFRPMQALYPYPLGLGLLLSVFLALQGLRWSGLAKDKMFATAQPLNDIKGRH